MPKKRIYQLANELNISSKELMEKLTELDIKVSSHMSTLEEDECALLLELLGDEVNTVVDQNENKVPTQVEEVEEIIEEVQVEVDPNAIEVEASMTVGDFAELLDLKAAQVITALIGLGIMATINQEIDFDTMSLIAEDNGKAVRLKETTVEDETDGLDFEDAEEDLMPRPPIVTVMGHVDHGKTSLLDAVRQTSVTKGEAGGITQHIGASTIRVKGEKIVFLDTPGHEAFTSMRARGAQVTDIAILVVAADDGVMPQTVEAINHAKAAGVPIIVAINKMDKEGANPDRVMQEMTEHGLVPESWGGDVIMIPVSAHTREGLDELLDMVLLVAEMQELKANPDRKAVGIIVEGELDKGKGSVATVLVKKGTLKVGDAVVAGTASGKVRAMIDDKGKKVKKAGPSIPVAILGLSEVPNAGDQLYAVSSDKIAREIAQKRRDSERAERLQVNKAVTLEDLFNQIKEGEIKDLNVIIKADVKGSIEAVKQSLVKLSNEEVKVNPIHGGVGAITEGDIMLASASNAIVIGFNVRPTNTALDAASREHVDVRTYRIIYKAIEDIEAAIKGMLKPEFKEVTLGRAEVRATFKVPNIGVVAGVYVQQGKVTRKSSLRLLRDNIVIHEGEVASLRRFKDDVKELLTGFEGGIGIENYNDIKDGDVIEAYIMEEVER
jgi:translation initiation factor IF-2